MPVNISRRLAYELALMVGLYALYQALVAVGATDFTHVAALGPWAQALGGVVLSRTAAFAAEVLVVQKLVQPTTTSAPLS